MSIDAATLQTLRARGGQWASYTNKALDSQNAGHQVFLAYGDGCTYQVPPDKYPGSMPTQWAYTLDGFVDLKHGVVRQFMDKTSSSLPITT